MNVQVSLALGIIFGIFLFFVLQRLGVIDKWISRLEGWAR
jgi:hypothetical protein